ncbi:MAG TPA: hypothetical protein VF800_03715 [Telluria sp.]
MSTQLVARLKNCCSNDRNLEPLLAQWIIDERLISKALQNISSLFSHFSRHDESHSTQILINIERVLGTARIAQLSGTNVWLLLESAYLHDIGMVVTYKQKRTDWDSESFRKFVVEQKHQAPEEDGELYDAILESNTEKLFNRNRHPFRFVTFLNHLFAEYYRRLHAGRAAQIALSPNESIGLDSPRNELIPNRLFRLLGEICAMHGRPHGDIMQMRQNATGLGNDLVHPRFIASMLRLGDLLDMDDNRFCPVMLRIAGELPDATQAHIDKHHAIQHLRIDEIRIEAHAVCTTYEGYVVTENWFDYLRQEIAWQMAHWADIVPAAKFGLLPTIGDISTELDGYELTENQTRPYFRLDQTRVMELLQGAGLYTSPQDILRELVQNAVDATLLYVWLKHGEKEAADLPAAQTLLANDSPYDPKTIDILSNYPMYVTVSNASHEAETENKVQNKAENKAKDKLTHIRISDGGVGISREDLASMSNIGNSFKGTWKRAVYERMPLWMRPSGEFGIGLQSVFMLTDEVSYETKSILNGETLKIRMSSPTSAEKGAIYIVRKKNTAVAGKIGTTIDFKIDETAEKRFEFQPHSFSHNDPIIKQERDYFQDIFDNIPIPTYFNGNKIIPKKSILNWNYDPNSGLAISIDFNDISGNLHMFFKGQKLFDKSKKWLFPCCVYVNIFGSAKDILTINRNELRNDNIYLKIISSLITTAKFLIKKVESNKEKAMLSTLLLSLDDPVSDDFLCMRLQSSEPDGIKQYIYLDDASEATFPSIRELLNEDLRLYQSFGNALPVFRFLSEHALFDAANFISLFFKAVVYEKYQGHIISANASGAIIGISKSEEAMSDSVLFNVLCFNLLPGFRMALPVTPRFRTLASMEWEKVLGEPSGTVRCPGREYMYSPFIVENERITTKNLKELIDWTFEHRLDRDVKPDEIVLAYQDFIRHVDAGMANKSEWVEMKGYRLGE